MFCNVPKQSLSRQIVVHDGHSRVIHDGHGHVIHGGRGPLKPGPYDIKQSNGRQLCKGDWKR
jgi:hypothetical protein